MLQNPLALDFDARAAVHFQVQAMKRSVLWWGWGCFVFVHIPKKGLWQLSKEQGLVVVFWAKWDPIWAKWDPSGQFVQKVGKSALELEKKNSIMGLIFSIELIFPISFLVNLISAMLQRRAESGLTFSLTSYSISSCKCCNSTPKHPFSWPELGSGQNYLPSGQPGVLDPTGQYVWKMDKPFLEVRKKNYSW